MQNMRTDLAVESRQAYFDEKGREPEGALLTREDRGGFSVSRLDITTRQAARALGKPMGTYLTMGLEKLLRRQENAFNNAAVCLAELLGSFACFPAEGPVLVVGLGNRAMTPDALGPLAMESVLVTRHLIPALPEYFGNYRSVAAFATGVLGTTGMEAQELVKALKARVKPAAVIAVDALAARGVDRLCRTIQLSDSGIVPGSGVGNGRRALNAGVLGVPVISVGVPTVVDAATMARDIFPDAAAEPETLEKAERFFVTPRDIDERVADCARLIGYGIDLALHPGLSVSDLDLFVT
jgi:spore protease